MSDEGKLKQVADAYITGMSRAREGGLPAAGLSGREQAIFERGRAAGLRQALTILLSNFDIDGFGKPGSGALSPSRWVPERDREVFESEGAAGLTGSLGPGRPRR